MERSEAASQVFVYGTAGITEKGQLNTVWRDTACNSNASGVHGIFCLFLQSCMAILMHMAWSRQSA